MRFCLKIVCGVKGVQARCERDVSSDQNPTFWFCFWFWFWWGKRQGFSNSQLSTFNTAIKIKGWLNQVLMEKINYSTKNIFICNLFIFIFVPF